MWKKFKMEEGSSKIEGLESFSKKTREWSCWNFLSRLTHRKRWVAQKFVLKFDIAWFGKH